MPINYAHSKNLPTRFLASWSLIALIFFLTVGAEPSLAADDQITYQIFDVHSVAQDDVLNVRAGPAASAEKIASLAANATNVEATGLVQTVDGAQWLEIRIGNGTGWANAYYLKPAQISTPRPDALFREPLSCSGTEPFWGLQIEGGTGELDSLSDAKETIHFKSSREAGGVPIIWSLRGHTQSTNSSAIAILEETNACSDGMSDLGYRYSIRLDVADGPFFAGCCNRLPGQYTP